MKKYPLTLIAFTPCLLAAPASADYIINSTRTTVALAAPSPFTPDIGEITNGIAPRTLVDVITFTVQNDGTNDTGTSVTSLYLTAATPTSGSDAGAFLFQTITDPDTGGNTVNTTANPDIKVGSSRGSWIRLGSVSDFSVFYHYNNDAQPDATLPETRNDPFSTGSPTFDPIPGYTNNHSFTVLGFVNGSYPAPTPTIFASLVVPRGTTVFVSGASGDGNGYLHQIEVFNRAFTPVRANGSYIWTGHSSPSGDGATWDFNNNRNWQSLANPAAPADVFYDKDAVTFDDAHNLGQNYSVNIDRFVFPASINVDTAQTYTFTGGQIRGMGALTKTGPGTLILANANNTYAGGTYLQQGNLILNAPGALPWHSGDFHRVLYMGDSAGHSATLNLNGFDASIDVNDISRANNIITNTSATTSKLFLGSRDIANRIAIQGNVELHLFIDSFYVSVPGTYTGDTYIESSLTLNNSITSRNIYMNGSLYIQSANVLSPDVNIYCTSSSGGYINLDADLTIGTLNSTVGGVVTFNFDSTLSIAHGGSFHGRFSSNIAHNTTLHLLGGTLSLSQTMSGPTTVLIDPGATLQLASQSTFLNSKIINNGSLIIDTSLGNDFSGNISGNSTVKKIGAGAWTFTGLASYTGVTEVSEGTLIVNGSLGNTSVHVHTGATLAGSGSIAGSVADEGTLSPGNSPGKLSLGSTLAFSLGSTLRFDVGPNAAAGADTDLIHFLTAGDNLLGSGNLTLQLIGALDYTKTYTIFDNVTTPNFTLAGIDTSGITNRNAAFAPVFSSDADGTYVVSFVAAPEPASLSTLALALPLMVRRRRTR